jgi:pimeloyl-ACP methyl ester carboxylesterase
MAQLIGDLEAILQWAGTDSTLLAGHDFGAALTWATTMFAPGLVRSAVTMAAPHPMRMHSVAGNLEQIGKAAYTFLMNAGERGEALLSAQRFELLERFVFGTNAAIPPDVRAAYRREWAEPGRFTAMAEWYRAHYTPDLLNPDVSLDLPRTSVPIRYVYSRTDFAFVDELAETNAPFVDGPYDHVRIDSSHWMLWEQPDTIARLMLEWFDRWP